MDIIYASFNGNSKTFSGEKKDIINQLKKEVKSYGKSLHSLKIEAREGKKVYNFSLLSACYYIVNSGKIPEGY